jgi:apolipoprotein N-acyltransferase
MITKLLSAVRQSRYAALVAMCLGAIFPLSLAPYHLWPIALFSVAWFADLLTQQTPKQALLRGWAFGTGMWGVGVSWLFVSIHDYGYTPAWLAVLMVAFVAVVMGLFSASMAFIYRRFNLDRHAILTFAPLFILFEWLKTWLFTGFPWLFTGYGFIDSVLVGYAPILGVFGVGLSVSIVQGNIPQDVKWQLEWRDKTLDIYRQLSVSEWGQNLVIWPEAAVPMFQYEANDFLKEMDDNALAKKSAFVTGIPYADLKNLDSQGVPPFYNSMAAIGDGGYGLYFKQRLVPFGEYVPFESLLRGVLPFFNLEMSSFSAGNTQQSPLFIKDYRLAAAICYEIAYPELTRRNAQKADFIATLSNDGWFGTSTGPHQHLQMVQMRALETGKWIIRATNTGISGFISPKGTLVKQAPQFKRTVLRGNVYPVIGKTPYSRLGDWPILTFCFGVLLWFGWRNYKNNRPINL